VNFIEKLNANLKVESTDGFLIIEYTTNSDTNSNSNSNSNTQAKQQ
jgi:hypothetical protein